jgi:hypothetical protein
MFTYWSIHDDSCLFHSSIELIEINFAFVLDVKVFEHLLKELGLIDIVCIFLHDFRSQLCFETIKMENNKIMGMG